MDLVSLYDFNRIVNRLVSSHRPYSHIHVNSIVNVARLFLFDFSSDSFQKGAGVFPLSHFASTQIMAETGITVSISVWRCLILLE